MNLVIQCFINERMGQIRGGGAGEEGAGVWWWGTVFVHQGENLRPGGPSFCHVPCGLQREQTQVLSLTGVFNFSGGWYPYMAFASHLLRLDSALQPSPSRENGNVTLSVAAN